MRELFASRPMLVLAALIAGLSLPPGARGADEIIAPGAVLVERHADPDQFFEGPTWVPGEQALYFTAFAGDQASIRRMDAAGTVTTWLAASEGINGTFLSRSGKLLGAQGGAKRIVALTPGEPEPTPTVLAHDADWHRPNDLCEAANGLIYFTDPNFEPRDVSPDPGQVYLLRPSGEVVPLVDELRIPNGVEVGADGETLYVSDSDRKVWRAYPIRPDGTVGEGRDFLRPATDNDNAPDGLTVDEQGRLYLTGWGGVRVVSPEGEVLAFIEVPEFASNCDFGGPEGRTLFITCAGKLYGIELQTRGLRQAP